MKIRIRSGQMISGLWRRFAPSALICLLLTFWFILSESITCYGSEALQQLSSQSLNIVGSALLMSLLFSTAASCLCERYRWHKAFPWLAAAAGAGTGALFVHFKIPEMIPTGVILCALALCLHGVSRKDAPAARLGLIGGRFITVSFVCGLLFGALSLSISAIFSLLLPEPSYQLESIFYTSAACISFLLFAPCLFLGGLPEDEKPAPGAFQKLFSFLLAPFFLLPAGIILFYVIKITLTWSMPVGVMNGYSLYALTAFVFFHLILTGSEDKLSAWFKRWGGWLLIPIAIVQGIAVHMRVSAYGLTPSRILGLVWTALCLGVVLTSLLRKRANWFFLAAGAVSLVLFCTPLSAENLAVMNQESRLRTALNANGMLSEQGNILPNPNASLEARKIIYSAADYLESAPARKGSFTEQLQLQLAAIQNADETKEESIFLSDAEVLLFGFTEPEQTEREWYIHHYNFKGTAVSTKLETRGYDYAEWISFLQYRNAGEDSQFYDKTETSGLICECTADIPAFIACLEASRDNGEPLDLTVPLTFVIDGEEIDLAPLLNGVQLTAGTADLPMDSLILPSGRKLHISSILVANYSDDNSSDHITLSAWLLTPEAE